MVPLILNLGTRCMVVSFKPQPLHSQERTRAPIEQEAGWAPDPVCAFCWTNKSLASYRNSNPGHPTPYPRCNTLRATPAPNKDQDSKRNLIHWTHIKLRVCPSVPSLLINLRRNAAWNECSVVSNNSPWRTAQTRQLWKMGWWKWQYNRCTYRVFHDFRA